MPRSPTDHRLRDALGGREQTMLLGIRCDEHELLPPSECARLIQEWIDMGITTPVLRFTAKDQLGQVKRFIEEVLPLLRLK